jgi:hypothetical protein
MIDSGNEAAGYAREVDTVDEGQWCRLIEEFDDANVGNRATYLFGATSHAGLQKRGAYLLHRKMIEWATGMETYDLNGIDPVETHPVETREYRFLVDGEIFRRTRGARIGPPSAIRWGNRVAEGNSR